MPARSHRAMQTAAVFASVLGAAAPALAHPHLKSSSPAADAVIRQTPTAVRISFSEKIVPKFSGLQLTKAGSTVSTGSPSADPHDSKVMVVPITGTLAPGAYTVAWHAVSVDTHRVEGRFSFKVAP